MSEASLQPQNVSVKNILLGMIPSLIIDAAIPYVIYILLRPYTTEFLALLASSIPPLISNIVSLIRSHKLDAFGTIIFLGIIMSIIAIFLGGDPRLLLVKESFSTVMLGIACLISLFFPKPLMFYISQHFVAGNNPEMGERFGRLWQYPIFRQMNYRLTIVWGIFFLCEFALKLFLVYTLPVSAAVGITPVVFYSLLSLIIIWTTIYSARVGKKGREMALQRQQAEEALQANEIAPQ